MMTLSLPLLISRQGQIVYLSIFYRKRSDKVNFAETVAASDPIVGRCRQLIGIISCPKCRTCFHSNVENNVQNEKSFKSCLIACVWAVLSFICGESTLLSVRLHVWLSKSFAFNQFACLVKSLTTIYSYGFLLNCTTVGSMTSQT